MAGYYADAEKHLISSWVLGCLEKEIDSHVEAERERIIELLETTIADWRRCDLYQQAELFDYAIQLIKGEQK